jgi:hypothetical protein
MLTFLILVITIIWCHSFTKLTSARGKCLNFLLYFVPFYLLFYSSYILRRRLRMTQQMTSWTTSSIAPEEARTAAILGFRRWWLHVFALDLYMDVMLYGLLCCVWISCMLWRMLYLNECVGFECVYECLNQCVFEYACFVISVVLVILFSVKKINPS